MNLHLPSNYQTLVLVRDSLYCGKISKSCCDVDFDLIMPSVLGMYLNVFKYFVLREIMHLSSGCSKNTPQSLASDLDLNNIC